MEKIGSYLSKGFDSSLEQLDLRFLVPDVQAGTVLEAFSAKFVLGASSALAAVVIGEVIVSMGKCPLDLLPQDQVILETFCLVKCAYRVCTSGGVPELVSRVLTAEMCRDP